MITPPLKMIASVELDEAAASVTLNVQLPPLAFTPRHLVALVHGRSTQAASVSSVNLRLNGDTGANYHRQDLAGVGSSPSALRANSQTSVLCSRIPGASAAANAFGGGQALFPDALSTRSHKAMVALAGAAEEEARAVGGRWASTAAITSVTLLCGGGEFVAGSRFELAVVDETWNVYEEILSGAGMFSAADLPQGDYDYVAVGNLRGAAASAADDIQYSLNGDTGASYDRQRISGSDTTVAATSAADRLMGTCPGDSADSGAFGALLAQVTAPCEGDNDASVSGLIGNNATSSSSAITAMSGRRDDVEAVTSFGLTGSGSANFVADSGLWVYKLPKRRVRRVELSSESSSIAFSGPFPRASALRLTVYGRGTNLSSLTTVQISLNGDTTAANYDAQHLSGFGTAALAGQSSASQSVFPMAGGGSGANIFGSGSVVFPNWDSRDQHKSYLAFGGPSGDGISMRGGRWESFEAITSIAVTLSSGDFAAGTVATLEAIGGPAVADYSLLIDKGQDGSFETAGDDISGDVLIESGVTARRGHNAGGILSPISSGNLRAVVENDDGDYDPGGATRAGLPVKFRAVFDQEYSLFSGALSEPEPEAGLNERIAGLSALGRLSRLSRGRISTALYESIRTDEAIGHVLDAVGWPAGDRELDQGQTVFDWWWLDEETPLDAIRDLVNSEGPGASVHEDGDLKLIFHNRHRILTHARSTSAQRTFNQLSPPYYAEPFSHIKSDRNVINMASMKVKTRTAKSTSVIWTGPASITLQAGESRTYGAKTTEPFTDAITPSEGTDYTLSAGGLDSVSLDRTSGVSVRITLTAGAQGATVTGLQLRADPVTVDDETVVENTLDTTQSVTDWDGVHAWSGRAREEIGISTAQDLVNAVCAFYRDSRAVLSFGVPGSDEASLVAGLDARINDRVRLVNSELGLDVQAYVLEVEHTVGLGRLHRAVLHCEQAVEASQFGIWGSGIWGTATWGF